MNWLDWPQSKYHFAKHSTDIEHTHVECGYIKKAAEVKRVKKKK